MNIQQPKRKWDDEQGAPQASRSPSKLPDSLHAKKQRSNALFNDNGYDPSHYGNLGHLIWQSASKTFKSPPQAKRIDSGADLRSTAHSADVSDGRSQPRTSVPPPDPAANSHFQMPSSVLDQSSRPKTFRTPAMPPSGTQANPISLDDDATAMVVPSETSAGAPLPQTSEKQFYGVARGLIPGVYHFSQKKDVKLCTHDWPGAKVRPFPSQSDAASYVQSRKIDPEVHTFAVKDFFGAWSYPTQKAYLRRKELYQWFRERAIALHLDWAMSIPGPHVNAFIKEAEVGGRVPGAELHDPSYNQEQYLRPALSSAKAGNVSQFASERARPAPAKHISEPKAYDHAFGHQKQRVPKYEKHQTIHSRAPPPTHQNQPILIQSSPDHEPPRSSQDFDRIRKTKVYQSDRHTPTLPRTPTLTSISSEAEPKLEPELCAEQRRLVELIKSGRNVFYTGSAGCGKSTVLKAFVRELREMGKDVRIVAPTGKAALEVNGTTYFTFAGWTPTHFKKPLLELKKGAHQKFVYKRMNDVSVLIIDEISMLENHIFERLNEVMKEARGSHDAFGGVQLVVTGDFCQLPPVKPFKHCLQCGKEMIYRQMNTSYRCNVHGEFFEKDKWAFRSRAWQECNFEHVNLTTIHRQRDRAFIDILERCRMGKQLTPKEMNLLLNHECDVQNPTRLYSTRAEVSKLNKSEYAKLRGKARTFACFDDALIHPHHPNLVWKSTKGPDGNIQALQEGKFEPRVDIKEGMRVVLQVNLSIEEGLVNGAQGVVVDWEPYDKEKMPKAKKEENRGGRARDAVAAVAPPQNTISGEHAQYREARVKDFVRERRIKEWPIVEFDNGRRRTIYAECLVYEFGDDPPYSIMSRTQVPLIAGWAMTVHKSQGMTLNKVEVDLEKSFEEGQMYVALSRATGLEGLKVRSLGHKMGGGNPEVHEFLRDRLGVKI